jgi:hypothetical protein
VSPAGRRWPARSPELVSVAGHGLPHTAATLPGWLGHADWPVLVDDCRANQLLGLLADAVADGARELDADEHGLLQRAVAAELMVSVALERDLLVIAGVLDHEGVPYRVLKGIANAHLDYPEPALRLYGDVDIAVAPTAMELAKAALEARGFGRVHPERRAGFDARYEKSILLFAPGTGHELDLHRSFISGPFGHCFDPADLFAGAEWFDLGGRPLPALRREERFVHACLSATISDEVPRIRPARDVVQLLLHPDLDLDRALAVAHGWGMGVLVARAITQSLDALGVGPLDHPLVPWARAYRPTRAEARRLHCYVGVSSSYVRRALSSMRELPSARDRASYALAMVRPDRDAVDSPITDRLRRATASLVRG